MFTESVAEQAQGIREKIAPLAVSVHRDYPEIAGLSKEQELALYESLYHSFEIQAAPSRSVSKKPLVSPININGLEPNSYCNPATRDQCVENEGLIFAAAATAATAAFAACSGGCWTFIHPAAIAACHAGCLTLYGILTLAADIAHDAGVENCHLAHGEPGCEFEEDEDCGGGGDSPPFVRPDSAPQINCGEGGGGDGGGGGSGGGGGGTEVCIDVTIDGKEGGQCCGTVEEIIACAIAKI